MSEPVKAGQVFVGRRNSKRIRIAIIKYCSVNGDVGYRLKGAQRIYCSPAMNFLRNYKPLLDSSAGPERGTGG